MLYCEVCVMVSVFHVIDFCLHMHIGFNCMFDESLKWPHSFIAVQNNICTLCIVFISVANTVTHD